MLFHVVEDALEPSPNVLHRKRRLDPALHRLYADDRGDVFHSFENDAAQVPDQKRMTAAGAGQLRNGLFVEIRVHPMPDASDHSRTLRVVESREETLDESLQRRRVLELFLKRKRRTGHPDRDELAIPQTPDLLHEGL